MAQVKKFTLVPEELVIKHTVSNKRLSELDKLMIKILNSDIPDQEKLTRYHEVLQTSLNLQEFNRPIVKIKENIKNPPTSKSLPNQEMNKKDSEEIELDKKEYGHYRDILLAAMTKSKRSKAENILTLIQQQPEVLSYNELGEISLYGRKLLDSNIIDFLNYMFHSRKVVSHKDMFGKVVNDLNIPKSFITNKRLLHSTEEDGSKKNYSVPQKKHELLLSEYNLRKKARVTYQPVLKWENM